MGLWVVWSEEKVVSLCVCVAGNIPEDRFVEYFVEALKKEEDGQFDTTVEQFMECAKACREGKLAERKAADAEQAARVASVEAELEQAKLSGADSTLHLDELKASMAQETSRLENAAAAQFIEMEASMAAEKLQLEAAMEDMRRAALLRAVYHEFDLDGGGDVGAEELMEVGQARRRLGQKSGEWTEANNRALMQQIGPDEEGIV